MFRPPPTASISSFRLRTRFGAVDWQTGKTLDGLMLVDTRPSMLYGTLFSSLGEKSRIFLDVLTGIAIFFGLIELVALVIGVRLTRSMTKSVAELYDATGHINRGDLTHRIQVRTQRPDGGAGAVVQLHDRVAVQADRRAEGEAAAGRRTGHRPRSAEPALPCRPHRPALAGGARDLPSGAHRERRLLRLHSPA